ncbi:MarR family winged helix-turn-helix transcriptional regulator [Nocardiopsis alkaliphila]|uniref:MarR family winged helix-turn-helix transcriptional regulator n=1 Tax=Nocardiopsis alkaliphila TaxID=225762 RepID=UPI000360BE1B|nr:MarR family transcriptional regulator [Nocardiopsis alkaliphila]
MEQTPARLVGKPSWLITQLSVHAHRLASDAFAEANARGYHYRILSSLDEFGTASQADLGRRSNMDRSDVVAAINELAEQGCVERTTDPGDRRRNLVSLTKAGEQQLGRLDRVLDKAQESLLEPLTAESRDTLVCLLSELLAHHQRG